MIKRTKQSHYNNDKEGQSIENREDIITVNIYAPNIRAPKYIKRILIELKEERNSNTIIVGNFNIHSQQWIDRSETDSITNQRI